MAFQLIPRGDRGLICCSEATLKTEMACKTVDGPSTSLGVLYISISTYIYIYSQTHTQSYVHGQKLAGLFTVLEVLVPSSGVRFQTQLAGAQKVSALKSQRANMSSCSTPRRLCPATTPDSNVFSSPGSRSLKVAST